MPWRVAALAFLAVAGCRCGSQTGQGALSASVHPFEWAAKPDLEAVPADGINASLAGKPLSVVHVHVREGADGSRIELSDRPPQALCTLATDAQGFSVKLPGKLGEGVRIEKTMLQNPRGVSAFMLERLDDGSARSVMASTFSMAVYISAIGKGNVAGRIALAFDDPKKSGAAGTFAGDHCPR